MPEDPGAVHLTGDDDSTASGHSPPERSPAVQHLSRRGGSSQAEIERIPRVTPAGDSRDDTVLLTPRQELVSGHRTFDGCLDHPSIRSIDAPSALSRSWMCSYPRSI